MENINTNPPIQSQPEILKTCTKCKKDFPATLDYFYKNRTGKYGITPRCKSCVNEDNQEAHEKRMQKDPDRIKAMANARSKKHYHTNLEEKRKYSRKKASEYRKDPEKRAKINARKRADGAGLTPEQIAQIRVKQDNKCAICNDPEPTDLDHCHESGEVRWLLCKHCNRGLGAFRDSSEFLRKAADLLEARES